MADPVRVLIADKMDPRAAAIFRQRGIDVDEKPGLPPEELNAILTLYTRVSQKTLMISRTLGIEGKKLLTPEDDYEALKDFTHAYEGTTTITEGLHLEYQRLMQENTALAATLELHECRARNRSDTLLFVRCQPGSGLAHVSGQSGALRCRRGQFA